MARRGLLQPVAYQAQRRRLSQALLGRRLIEDCVDADTGELHPIAVVTDNGPAMKSAARWFAHRAHFTHVRTRHRSPHRTVGRQRAPTWPPLGRIS